MADQTNPQASGEQPNAYQAAYSQPQPAAPQPTAAQAATSQATAAYPAAAQHAPTAVPPAAPAHSQHGKKGSGGKTFLIAFAGALAACLVFFGVTSAVSLFSGGQLESNSTESLGAQTSTVINVNDDVTLAESVAAKCLPSVAAVDVYARGGSMDDLYSFFYGYGTQQDGELEASGLGSGVVLSQDGYVVTNYHVVEGGEAYKVTIEGETYDADLVGSDPSSDIAVLKARDASGLTAMEIGDSDDLTIGEWVMSIGSPFGLEQSVATGIISATSRSQVMDSSSTGSGDVTVYPNMIQTDAAINPGNSGGALVDANGQLVGINTLITSYSGNYSGVGFAIPVNYAINLAQQIIDGDTPSHAQLGVTLSTVNSQMAARYGLSANEGAYIASVGAGTGAAAAGLTVGDIVTAFDGQKVESASDLMLDVRGKNPGDTVTLTVVNGDGQQRDVQVTLGSDQTTRQASGSQQGSSIMDLLQRGGSQGQGA